jgi:hypothetical protein
MSYSRRGFLGLLAGGAAAASSAAAMTRYSSMAMREAFIVPMAIDQFFENCYMEFPIQSVPLDFFAGLNDRSVWSEYERKI